ncbi:hypothetical protein ACIBP6_06625 [Nonomuraea terrae]|uniref:hypothetical protein n=1 Tax=Nonomuraea terrae TaxID=2530383 RepID=UPI00378EAF72
MAADALALRAAKKMRAPSSWRSASVASSSMSWSTARADRRPPRRMRNSAGVSAPGQEARSVRHSVMGGPRGAVQERDLAGGLALAGADDDLAFARRERDVVVQSDELGDPDAGVEQQPAKGAVAGERAAFDGAQAALLPAGVQGAGASLAASPRRTSAGRARAG